MPQIDEIFNISLLIDNSVGHMVIRFKDSETGVNDEVRYELDVYTGSPEEYDNIAEFLLDKAKDALIEGKKRYRYNPDF